MIAIVDYGMGNLGSVAKGVEKVGGKTIVTSDPEKVAEADKVILPGVGAFGDAAKNLRDLRLIAPMLDAIKAGKPFLGICLGQQLLQDSSEETPGSPPGLGVIPGTVKRFPTVMADGSRVKVPHIGWNQVEPGPAGDAVSAGVKPGTYFYFVHSYYVLPEDDSTVALWCEYAGVRFAAMVAKDNVYGVQFHPEKSQAEGLALLKRFVEL